jgi:hypothetical protein
MGKNSLCNLYPGNMIISKNTAVLPRFLVFGY